MLRNIYLHLIHELIEEALAEPEETFTPELNREMVAFIAQALAYYNLADEEKQLLRDAATILEKQEPDINDRYIPVLNFMDGLLKSFRQDSIFTDEALTLIINELLSKYPDLDITVYNPQLIAAYLKRLNDLISSKPMPTKTVRPQSESLEQVLISNWTVIGEEGSAPGQFKWPDDIAIDQQSGVIWVADRLNNRIQASRPEPEPAKPEEVTGDTHLEPEKPEVIVTTSDPLMQEAIAFLERDWDMLRPFSVLPVKYSVKVTDLGSDRYKFEYKATVETYDGLSYSTLEDSGEITAKTPEELLTQFEKGTPIDGRLVPMDYLHRKIYLKKSKLHIKMVKVQKEVQNLRKQALEAILTGDVVEEKKLLRELERRKSYGWGRITTLNDVDVGDLTADFNDLSIQLVDKITYKGIEIYDVKSGGVRGLLNNIKDIRNLFKLATAEEFEVVKQKIAKEKTESLLANLFRFRGRLSFLNVLNWPVRFVFAPGIIWHERAHIRIAKASGLIQPGQKLWSYYIKATPVELRGLAALSGVHANFISAWRWAVPAVLVSFIALNLNLSLNLFIVYFPAWFASANLVAGLSEYLVKIPFFARRYKNADLLLARLPAKNDENALRSWDSEALIEVLLDGQARPVKFIMPSPGGVKPVDLNTLDGRLSFVKDAAQRIADKESRKALKKAIKQDKLLKNLSKGQIDRLVYDFVFGKPTKKSIPQVIRGEAKGNNPLTLLVVKDTDGIAELISTIQEKRHKNEEGRNVGKIVVAPSTKELADNLKMLGTRYDNVFVLEETGVAFKGKDHTKLVLKTLETLLSGSVLAKGFSSLQVVMSQELVVDTSGLKNDSIFRQAVFVFVNKLLNEAASVTLEDIKNINQVTKFIAKQA